MAEIYSLPQVTDYAAVVAGNVRAEAARRGFNQVRLARVLGIAQSNVFERWHGRKPYNVAELAAIAEAFGVEVEELTRRPRVSESASSARPKGLEPPTFCCGACLELIPAVDVDEPGATVLFLELERELRAAAAGVPA